MSSHFKIVIFTYLNQPMVFAIGCYLVQKSKRTSQRCSTEEQHPMDQKERQSGDLCPIQSETQINDIGSQRPTGGA